MRLAILKLKHYDLWSNSILKPSIDIEKIGNRLRVQKLSSTNYSYKLDFKM